MSDDVCWECNNYSSDGDDGLCMDCRRWTGRIKALIAERDQLAAQVAVLVGPVAKLQWTEVEYHAWQCLCQGPNGIGWQHTGAEPPKECDYTDCFVERMKESLPAAAARFIAADKVAEKMRWVDANGLTDPFYWRQDMDEYRKVRGDD